MRTAIRDGAGEGKLVAQEGESLNTLFQTLSEWEQQLKGLEEDIPNKPMEPSP